MESKTNIVYSMDKNVCEINRTTIFNVIFVEKKLFLLYDYFFFDFCLILLYPTLTVYDY